MLNNIHGKKGLQLVLGLLVGVCFGFLLQKGGVAYYDVIMGQLLLDDFTVIKVMLSAVVTGMIGIYFMKSLGMVRLHPKAGSFGSSVLGGLIFGVGFGLLGYCPGTVAAAVGQGNLDALLGGVVGILIGAGLFASMYPRLQASVLNRGDFGNTTLPQLFKMNPWIVVPVVTILVVALLYILEQMGL
jgi:uncharacterized protein